MARRNSLQGYIGGGLFSSKVIENAICRGVSRPCGCYQQNYGRYDLEEFFNLDVFATTSKLVHIPPLGTHSAFAAHIASFHADRPAP